MRGKRSLASAAKEVGTSDIPTVHWSHAPAHRVPRKLVYHQLANKSSAAVIIARDSEIRSPVLATACLRLQLVRNMYRFWMRASTRRSAIVGAGSMTMSHSFASKAG